jgi:predicted HNH restriction endonuclease
MREWYSKNLAAGLTAKGKQRKPVRVAATPERRNLIDSAKSARWRAKFPERAHAWRRDNREQDRANARESRRKRRYDPDVLERRRARFSAARMRAIDRLGGACSGCGFSDHRALEFDHRTPLLNTKGRGSSIYEILRMEDPHAVYQLLCANCHTIKTKEGREHWAHAKRRCEPTN